MTFKEYLESENSDFNEILRRNSKDILDLEHKPMNVKYVLNKQIEDLYGFEFYQIINALKFNIDKVAKAFFSDIPLKKINVSKNTEGLNSFEKFVNQFLIDQRDFAGTVGIDPTRLNKILKRDRKDFYAYEVFHISVLKKIKAKSAFEQLYKE